MKPFFYAVCLSLICSYAQSQQPFGYPYDSITNESVDTLFYEFVDGFQMIQVTHVGAYWRRINMIDQSYPRGLSAAVETPKPVSDEYYIRDSLGKIIKAHCTHHSLKELNKLFASVPISRQNINKINNPFFVVSNQRGGLDRVSFSGNWTKKGLAYGLINRKGEQVTPVEYQQIYLTNSAIHLMKGYKWALMDKSLNFLTDFEYDRIVTYPLRDTSISEITYLKKDIQNGTKYCGFQVPGINQITETSCYDHMHVDINWLKVKCIVVTKDKKGGLMDFEGNIVLPLEYDGIHFTNDKSCSNKPCVRLSKGSTVKFVDPQELLPRKD